MLADRLNKDWAAARSAHAIEALMRFTDEGLVLGAGTILAPARPMRTLSIDPNERRLRALLTAAHLAVPIPTALAHLQKAADRWREGEDALAAMHLVLSRLDRLEEPEADAHRLFLADSLLRAGAAPDEIIRAIESVMALGVARKYDSDEARVPAGSGRPSGQWTASNGAGAPSGAAGSRAGRSARGPRSKALPARSSEVNPDTITPVAGGHKATSDTGRIAMADCIRHVAEDSVGAHANDNWKEDWTFECVRTKNLYLKAEYMVEMDPKFKGGIVLFPDGGLIIMRKGKDDVYIPAQHRNLRTPPFKRAV